MKISRLQGLKKANNNLYSCSNIDALAASARNEDGESKTLKELCNEILVACGAKPLNSLETAPSRLTAWRRRQQSAPSSI